MNYYRHNTNGQYILVTNHGHNLVSYYINGSEHETMPLNELEYNYSLVDKRDILEQLNHLH